MREEGISLGCNFTLFPIVGRRRGVARDTRFHINLHRVTINTRNIFDPSKILVEKYANVFGIVCGGWETV